MNVIKKFLQDNLFLKNGSCPICGKVLFSGENYFCEACEKILPLNSGPVCDHCGRGLKDDRKILCTHCQVEKLPFYGGYAHFHYYMSAKKVVSALKFKSRPHLGSYMGEVMVLKACENQPWLGKIELVIPIPIHEKRLKERGYNQSDFIVNGIFKQLNQKRSRNGPQISKTLIRSQNSPHQVGQSQKKRRESIIGAFDIVNPSLIEGKTILLADDVLTTGSTLGEAANTLIEGGAAAVYIMVIAALAD